MSELAYINLTKNILEPQKNNFTPPSRTPWGGYKIMDNYKRALGVEYNEIIGESWEISGHPSFPNYFINEECESISILDIGAKYPNELYGKDVVEMPFLVKLLNSGSWVEYRERLKHILTAYEIPEVIRSMFNIQSWDHLIAKNNHDLHSALKLLAAELCDDGISLIYREMLTKNLSVQVHPKKGDYLKKPAKTEAWLVLEAEKGAGIYLGLKKDVTKEAFEIAMASNKDLSQFLNFIEVSAGEVYLIPSGTMHAIGAGLLLLEPQETSETTFRAYDWGRLQDGKPRQLHLEETMKSTTWHGLRGKSLLKTLRLKPKNINKNYQQLVDIDEFKMYRLTFSNFGDKQLFDTNSKIHGWVVIDGSVEVFSEGNKSIIFQAGQSIILPAAIGKYSIVNNSKHTVLIQVI